MPFLSPFGPCYQPPPYSWSSSVTYYGYHYPEAIAPPPPPPYNPNGFTLPPPYTGYDYDDDDDDKRYKTPDIKRIKIHVIKDSPSDLFSGRSVRVAYKGYNLPLSMGVSDFFKEVDAFKHKNAVIEEAVEEGNGRWSRGAKLYWGCKEPSSLKAVQWRRGCGLKAASEQVVWVLIRPKTFDDK